MMTPKKLRAGHAPDFMREAFMNAVSAYAAWCDGEPEPTVQVDDEDLPISAVLGAMWNCTDVLPWEACQDINALCPWQEDFHHGSYARGARRILGWMKAA